MLTNVSAIPVHSGANLLVLVPMHQNSLLCGHSRLVVQHHASYSFIHIATEISINASARPASLYPPHARFIRVESWPSTTRGQSYHILCFMHRKKSPYDHSYYFLFRQLLCFYLPGAFFLSTISCTLIPRLHTCYFGLQASCITKGRVHVTSLKICTRLLSFHHLLHFHLPYIKHNVYLLVLLFYYSS